ncbi:uncharacterized protein [Temnothorax nylanderi]|uniref:uncharacterized protein isoform X2 n=1 Tax=Temnothorax nylanderi TaxID=102681 RepID=UPI003A8BE29F
MTEKTCYAVVEFMDGLQVIPTNWLSQDRRSALWPNFTNNKSYDKAIKTMIDPESTWASHSIKKIFGTFVFYVRAMKKLKEAEDTSDLNSGTEKEEFLKKSRKLRAAKPIDSSNDEEEESDDSFVSELPTIPKKRCHEITQNMSKNKVGRPRKDINYIGVEDNANKENNDQNIASYDITKKNSRNNYNANKEKSVQNIASYTTKKNSELQNHEVVFDNYVDCVPQVDSNYNIEPLEKIYLPSATTLSADRLPLSTTSSNSNSKDENFKKYIITKIITFESAIDDIKKIKKSVKLIADKLSIDIIDKKKENMDTTKDFPLKNQTELDTLEDKLQSDEGYRNELIKQLCRARSGNMRTFCIRLMRLIFSNELATKYSWLGTKKKEIFSTLHICKVIMSVIRNSHSDVSDDQIAAPIKIWLAHAPERFNRQKINHNQEDNQEDNQEENREENREENQDEEN